MGSRVMIPKMVPKRVSRERIILKDRGARVREMLDSQESSDEEVECGRLVTVHLFGRVSCNITSFSALEIAASRPSQHENA
jgi:hypothetical protein